MALPGAQFSFVSRSLVLLLLFSFLIVSPARAQIQTDPQVLQFPATGFWNGFLSQLNYVECVNHSSTGRTLNFTVRSNTGATLLSSQNLALPANGSAHFDLNAYPIQNAYGTYVITSTGDNPTGVACWTQFYRIAQPGAGKLVEYGYSLPVRNSQYGNLSGAFNSFDPEGGGVPTLNWLSIVNKSDDAFSATIALWDLNGAAIGTVPLTNLAANSRIDLPLGHDSATNGGQVIGSYQIQPANDRQPYDAFLIRYKPTAGGERYQFAFPLVALHPTCGSQPVPISTMDPATNWFELLNSGASSVQFTISFRDNGLSELQTITETLGAHAQRHIFVNSILGERNVGQARISCSPSTAELGAQSVFYGHQTAGTLVNEWAYASQLRNVAVTPGIESVVPVNSNLGMLNWWKIANARSTSNSANVALANGAGESISSTGLALAGSQSIDIELGGSLGPNAIGVGTLSSSTFDSRIGSELVRVFGRSGAALGYVYAVPGALVLDSTPSVALQTVVASGGVNSPVALANAGDGSDRLFIVEREGIIKILSGGSVLGTPFLDIHTIVHQGGGERGLLGLAFHPDYSSNGFFYVYYTDLGGDIQIARYSVSGDPNEADPGSAQILLSIEHSARSNHNGGQIAFGPDGYLYIGTGDGGGGGDPDQNGQDLQELLAKILRIDVDTGSPYGIPSDNPFVSTPSARDEIYAYGMRNPWRFSFDRGTGRLFVADVGQGTYEEVNIVEAGGNYGWNIREGAHCYPIGSTCSAAGKIDPIYEYDHDEGTSVIGGFVYRGAAIPRLTGQYVFADLSAEKIWTLTETSGGGWNRRQITTTVNLITSFGEDEDGEIYVAHLDGRIAKLIPQ